MSSPDLRWRQKQHKHWRRHAITLAKRGQQHRTLLRGGLNLYNSTVWTLCRYEKYPRNIQWRDSGTPVQRRRDVRPFLPFINALSGAVASALHAPPAIALSTCWHDATSAQSAREPSCQI